MRKPIYALNPSSPVTNDLLISWGFCYISDFCTSPVLKRESGNIKAGFLFMLFEVEMLCAQVQVLLVTLFSSVLLMQVSGTPRRDTLTETPRGDLAKNKDLTHLLLLKFVSVRGDKMLQKLLEDEDEDEEELGVRAEVMRRHLSLSQRDRKEGCRNFFWKTFTSC